MLATGSPAIRRLQNGGRPLLQSRKVKADKLPTPAAWTCPSKHGCTQQNPCMPGFPMRSTLHAHHLPATGASWEPLATMLHEVCPQPLWEFAHSAARGAQGHLLCSSLPPTLLPPRATGAENQSSLCPTGAPLCSPPEARLPLCPPDKPRSPFPGASTFLELSLCILCKIPFLRINTRKKKKPHAHWHGEDHRNRDGHCRASWVPPSGYLSPAPSRRGEALRGLSSDFCGGNAGLSRSQGCSEQAGTASRWCSHRSRAEHVCSDGSCATGWRSSAGSCSHPRAADFPASWLKDLRGHRPTRPQPLRAGGCRATGFPAT